MTNLDDKLNPQTVDPDVRLSEKLLDAYESAAGPHRKQMKEDEDFKNGAQWTKEGIKELKAKKQFPVVVNVVAPTVDQGVALLTTNKPRFTSTGREDSDTATGRLFSDILSYVWDISDGNSELKVAVDDYYTKGIGWLWAYQDPNADFGKGEVFVRNIDPFDVFIDPNSKDRLARDAAHILIVQIHTKEQLLRLYPQYKEQILQAKKADNKRLPEGLRYGLEGQTDYDGFLDQEHDHYETIDRYSKIKTEIHKILDNQDNSERIFNDGQYKEFLNSPAYVVQSLNEIKYVTSVQEVMEMEALYEKTGGVFHMQEDPLTGEQTMAPGEEDAMSVPGSTVRIYPTTMSYMVDNQVLTHSIILEDRIKRVFSTGGVKLYNGIMDISEYPGVPFMNRHSRNPYPASDVRLARGLQEYINKIRSLIVAHASSSTNVKLLIPRGATNKAELESQWAKAGTGVIEFDPEIGTPIVAGPIALPNELYKNEADAKKDIEFIFGIWQMQMGNAEAAPNTFKGTVALDEFGQRRIKSKKDDIEAGLNQLAKVIIQLIQQTYTEAKVIRLLRPNNEPKEILINQPIYDDVTQKLIGRMNDITIGKYDVVVVSGSMLPSNRFARFEYYMELYKAQLIDQIEVLKQTELVDIEGVLNRFNIITQLQQQVMAMEEEIKKLRGDLQTADREAEHAKKQAKLAKFESNVKGLESEMGASSQIYNARMNDELKMQKERARLEQKKKTTTK